MKAPARLLLAGCIAALAGAAHAQDPGKASGGLLRPAAPAASTPLRPAPTGDLVELLAQSVDNIDEPREMEIGRQLAAVLLGSKPLQPDDALQRYVNRLGRWIALQSPRPQLAWTFGVLDDPGFNAFAAPGGYVFVTRGLVDRVDEAELAGILAHEISHVVEKHHLKALSARARSGAAGQLLGTQVLGHLGSAISGQLIPLGRELYVRGLDQADEFESDREGVALAARAGFDPFGLPAVLQQLRTETADDPLFALTISTHPPAQQRLEQLERAMGSRLDAYSGQPSVPIARRLQ